MANKVNRCQYWSLYEPPQCGHWDASGNICDYSDESDPNGIPSHAPYCNLVGTSLSCNKYTGTGGSYEPRCILPDPSRHVCNRETGEKWVTSGDPVEDEDTGDPVSKFGQQILEFDFSPINGYNEGDCDGEGRNTTCSGYSPYHLGFGELQPSDSDEYDTFEDGRFSTIDEFGYRLPLDFVVYNIRAKLGKCYWWDDEPGIFEIDGSTGEIELKSLWACTNPNDTSIYSEFNLDNGPPCNGCKYTECPYYTGICWEYCIGEFLESGDPVLAEQIHELRYYHREHKWTVSDIENIFLDEGNIFSWKGTNDDDGLKGNLTLIYTSGSDKIDYEIPSRKVSMDFFDYFDVNYEDLVLTNGTTVASTVENYPTLIRQIQELPLSPIIKNRFHKGVSGENIFETPHLNKSEYVSIFGKVFYRKESFAVNMNDKEIRGVFPPELFYLDSIYEIEYFLGEKNFDIFCESLESAMYAVSKVYSHKIIYNERSVYDGDFLFSVPLFYKEDTENGTNESEIFVFQQIGKYFTFDKIKVTPTIIGGVLLQTEFKVEGDGGKVGRTGGIPDYEVGFYTPQNDNNGIMSFKFSPFISNDITSQVSYTYNDAVFNDDRTSTTMFGYKIYKITIPNYILETETYTTAAGDNKYNECYNIGSSGLMLISLKNDEGEINSVFGEWEVGSITLNQPRDGITSKCEMEIIMHGGTSETLPSHQLLIEPKNMEDYKAFCRGDFVILEDIVYYQKMSFGQEPTINFGSFEFIEEKDTVDQSFSYTLSEVSVNIDHTDSSYKLSFEEDLDFRLTLGTVLNDSTGRPLTQSKTKALGMVKQPACPEVEIDYRWSADFDKYPQTGCACCGPWKETKESTSARGYSPDCADHYYGTLSETGPLLWPFNSCASFGFYDYASHLSNWEAGVMGPFKEKSGDSYIHGQHDMRMLAPQKSTGSILEGCSPFFPCVCDWEHINYYRSSSPWFSGWARIRSGVSSEQIGDWLKFYSPATVIFGNELRPVLRYYLTMDYVKFQRKRLTSEGFKMEYRGMLMPAFAAFSKADITSTEDEMWDYFCSGEGPNVINPLGLFLANEFDGVTLSEVIDDYNRFRFEEIIESDMEFDLAYPSSVGEYSHTRLDMKVNNCYKFKKYPISIATAGDNYIQWAWQEAWKSIKRNYLPHMGIDFLIKAKENMYDGNIKGNFIFDSGEVLGILPVSVEYPMYQYNWSNEEFRLTINEGPDSSKKEANAAIFFIAPKKDKNTGEYIGYPKLRLNNGPERGITSNGEWLDEIIPDGLSDDTMDALNAEYNVELYQTCTEGNSSTGAGFSVGTVPDDYWTDKVSLFNTGYNNDSKTVAENEDRCIKKLTNDGEQYKVYFQRGLNVELFPEKFGRFPLNVKFVPPEDYSLIGKLGNEFVCGTSSYNSLGIGFDNKKKTIGRMKVTYKFGPEVTDVTPEGDMVYKFYHRPAIVVYNSNDAGPGGYASLGEELYNVDYFKLYDGSRKGGVSVITDIFEWDNSVDYVLDGKKGLVIHLRNTPTEEEVSNSEVAAGIEGRYSSTLNSVHVTNIQIYEEILTDGVEKLKVWERKYYVSYNDSTSVYPTQGKESDDQVLKSLPTDYSTIWQIDDYDGVEGVNEKSDEEMSFMNKFRGRHVGKIYEDETKLSGGVPYFEDYQKELYDTAVNKATSNSTMYGNLPPGLKELLESKGVKFDVFSNLKFTNTLPSKLAKINKFPNFAGEGYKYQPVPPHYYQSECQDKCGDVGFLYAYKCLDDIEVEVTSGAGGAGIFGAYTDKTYMHMQQEQLNDLLRGNAGSDWGRDTSYEIYNDLISSMTHGDLAYRIRYRTYGGSTASDIDMKDVYNDWVRMMATAWTLGVDTS